MNEKKQLAINLIAQIFAFLVSICISFFVTPYIINNIGTAAFGFVGLSNDFVNYAMIITIALNSMAARFITLKFFEKKEEEANKLFNTVLVSNIMMAIALFFVAVFVIFFLDRLIDVPANILADVRWLFVFIFSSFIFGLMTSVFGVAPFTKNKLYYLSIVQITTQFVRLVVIFSCLYFFPPAVWYIGLASLIMTIVGAIMNYVITRNIMPEIKLSISEFDFGSLKTLIAAGIWNSITRIGALLATGLDLLIANQFVGATLMGVLSASKILPTVILSAFGVVSSVFAPLLVKSFAEKNTDQLQKQLSFAIKLSGALACIPMAVLFAYGAHFFELWLPTQDAQLLHILTIVTCFAFVFSLPLEPLWNVFVVTNKVKYSSIFILISSFITIVVVFIGVSLTSNPIYQLYIIAGVSTISSIIRSLTFLPLVSAKLLNLRYGTFYGAIIKNTIVTIFVTMISLLIARFLVIDSWLTLFVASGITGVIAVVINVYILFTKTEREKYGKLFVDKIRGLRS